MKKILIITILVAAAAFGYRAFKTQVQKDPAMNTKIADMTNKIKAAVIGKADALKSAITNQGQGASNSAAAGLPSLAKKPSQGPLPNEAITIYLKHGGVISGKLLGKTENEYTVDWKGEKYSINAMQIARVEYKSQKDIDWQYKNDVVVKKINGVVMDGQIIDAGQDALTLSYSEGGGNMEIGVAKKDIDYLMFAPVEDKESQEIERHLKEIFPKMKAYKDGNVTMLTDSYVTTVGLYKKTIREEYTQIYLKFFKLFNGRKPQKQNFVVIFDDPVTYTESTGMPYWWVAGYFDPLESVLYLYNGFGDRIEKMVFDIIAGRTGMIDKWYEEKKKQYNVDKRYDIFIDGWAKEIKDKFWNAYNLYKSELTEETLSTLRHELTHELFHNWGLQNIILSKPNIDKEKLAKEKKEFVEAKDWKKKEEIITEIMKLRKDEKLEMAAAQSWLAEGMSTYCETEPMGAKDDMWLFLYQEMVRKNELNPIEFLTNFKMGSFPGLSSQAMLDAYAESWALTTFLMNKYPSQFIDYQDKMAAQVHKKLEEKDDLKLLLASLNKDLPTLEKEFKEFMATYGKAEDPDIKRFMKFHEIFND